MSKKKTHEQFLEEIKDKPLEVIEGIYSGNKVKLKFKCKLDGWEWWSRPNDILSGYLCPSCGRKSVSDKLSKKHEQFLEEIKDRPFEVIEGTYVNNHIKLKFKCKIDGYEWEAIPSHMLNSGCPKCKKRILSSLYSKTHEQFLENIKNKTVELISGVYTNNWSKLKFKCKLDGWEWWSRPNAILRGYLCPKCNSSKGELAVETWLKEHNITYEIQKRFSNCRNINLLPFDFYIPEMNTCIEFDGEHHYMPVSFGSKKEHVSLKNLVKTIITDEIKDSFCLTQGIKLIRIAYNENVIEKLNKEVLNED